MRELELIKLQALDFTLKNIFRDNSLDIKIVILYDSKLLCGDFVMDVTPSSINQYKISYNLFSAKSCFKYELYNEFLEDCKMHINLPFKENGFNYESFLEYALNIIDSTDINLKSSGELPRPVIYNAFFMESGINLPFVQLDAEKKYTLVSIIDSKLLQN